MVASSDFPEQDGVALVIGGSGGIGRAICAKLAAAGSDVVLTYRSDQAAAEAAAETVRAHGRSATTYALSTENNAVVDTVCAEIISDHRRIHTVVNAAGSHISMKYIADIGPGEFRQVMDADTNGYFNIVHALLPHMRHAGGSFVTISTTGLLRWPAKDALSVVPKAAIDALMTGIAREEGRNGIRANTVALGLIDAGLFRKLIGVAYDDKYIDAAIRNSALKRLGTADEVAEAVLFFASHRARFVTGQTLTLDGGYSL
ncbi:SDR family NAD(P)-dependent oxidoreductase [Sphingomonas sp. KC8]|uniref:SDR family NAD(P)-dependent oxidoreductase n=1 Tax=Sphingomonas sp. KC8 TaxID=1030157 RepID=UPI0002489FCB|nr:SDR family oxidoreductase [Sphingomonas sp. KC8]ARS29491.1 short-chain dehydrogenase [Sphingomonas sp. KC8]